MTYPILFAALAALGLLGLFFLRRRLRRRWIVVDGSNVMYWDQDVADIRTVRRVVAQLRQAGFHPLIWFDANAGYKLADRYMGPIPLARQLGVRAQQVRVAQKGTPADPFILSDARRLRAPVVSNDRFRDWWDDFPEAERGRQMIRGRVVGKDLKLDIS
ncbi:NYN domain-containing protein [Marivivens marinus]|uniref:NYN domain-containing protein n=1 Tax=Marivivens marinus TaxID=3110173 RepID=UPI003B848B88